MNLNAIEPSQQRHSLSSSNSNNASGSTPSVKIKEKPIINPQQNQNDDAINSLPTNGHYNVCVLIFSLFQNAILRNLHFFLFFAPKCQQKYEILSKYY